MSKRAINRFGFTLLEVIIAVAILAMAFSVLIGTVASSSARARSAEDLTVATMLARQKMIEIEIELKKGMLKGEFPEDKQEEGEFPSPFARFKWKMTIKKVDLPAPIAGEKGSVQERVGSELTKAISQSVRELKLTLSWVQPITEREKSFDITTHIIKM